MEELQGSSPLAFLIYCNAHTLLTSAYGSFALFVALCTAFLSKALRRLLRPPILDGDRKQVRGDGARVPSLQPRLPILLVRSPPKTLEPACSNMFRLH